MTDGLVIHNAILDKFTFDQWGNKREGFGVTILDNMTVNIKKSFKDTGAFDSYGEAYQGWEGEAYIIFAVVDKENNIRYFKKSGTVDSYLGVSWDGKFAEVQPTPKTVVEYEYK